MKRADPPISALAALKKVKPTSPLLDHTNTHRDDNDDNDIIIQEENFGKQEHAHVQINLNVEDLPEYAMGYASMTDSDQDHDDEDEDDDENDETDLVLVSDTERIEIIDNEESIEIISNFTKSDQTYFEALEDVIIGLRLTQNVVIQGQYALVVLKGKISIYGTTITAGPTVYPVFAPCSSPLPSIEAVDNFESIISAKELIKALIPENFLPSDSFYRQSPVLIAILTLRSGIENLDKICLNLKNLWLPAGIAESDANRSFYIHNQNSSTLRISSSVSVLKSPQSWSSVIDQISKTFIRNRSQRVLICGPKSAGKSTFARILLNFFTRRSSTAISYLDLDPGQPEFTPPGMLSLSTHSTPLFGPPISHPWISETINALHFGFISPRSDTTRYRKLAHQLISQSNPNHEDALPLIINTAGWTKGEGIDLLDEFITSFKPSIVVYIGPAISTQDFDINLELANVLLNSDRPFTFYELSSPASQNGISKYSAADMRAAQTMSYFHSQPAVSVGEHLFTSCSVEDDLQDDNMTPQPMQRWDFITHLLDFKPVVISYGRNDNSDDNDDDVDVGLPVSFIDRENACGIWDEHVPVALEQTVVAVDLVSGRIDTRRTTDESNLRLVTSEVSQSRSLALAFFQSINAERKQFNLILPAASRDIHTMMTLSSSLSILVLSRGRLQMPIWGIWEGNQNGVRNKSWHEVPYLEVDDHDDAHGGGAGNGLGRRALRIRRQIQRRSQVKKK
ncbi:hypothetical protein V1514DRAFT_326510 [Lipomyces japonicus]|uniref:uncharacterized protein n=1 Tax=Lipomyces japonicus TaxID=56871 RepID=UPI0034CF00B7